MSTKICVKFLQAASSIFLSDKILQRNDCDLSGLSKEGYSNICIYPLLKKTARVIAIVLVSMSLQVRAISH